MQTSKMDGLLHCIKTTKIIQIDNQPHVAKDELLSLTNVGTQVKNQKSLGSFESASKFSPVSLALLISW